MAQVRRLAVLCLTIVAPAVFGQARLNPTVKVLPKPSMIVPTDCAEGLAPAPPPVETEVEAAPKAPVVAPSSDLRTALRRVQAAAENNDYNGFKDALADARAAVSAYPGGGEKQAANDVLQVDADIQRLWDYSITSPTGAFFNASNEDLLAMLRKYPGWTRAVADATMTVGGETIYPSRETRQFLTEEAAKRLRNLGVRTPTRVVQEQPRITTPPKVTTRTRTTPKRQPAPQPRVHVATHHTPKPAIKIAQAAPRPAVHKRHEEEKAPIVATPVPAPVPVPKPAPVPAPLLTPATTTTQTTAAAPATTSTAAEPRPAVPTTATTATTATTESAPAATTSTEATSSTEKPAGAAGGMNLTFAIILIVVGIGVLIVLFRASD